MNRNDVTYLNGEEIGRTHGWDTPRNYVLPERLIRWGKDNVLTMMVDNPTYGGGLYKPPYLLLVGDSAVPSKPVATVRASPRPRVGKIGKPLPLRRMKVIDGVLRYPDGAGVALWGVNYYLQKSSFSAPVAELEENVHLFRLKLPGWEKAQCFRAEGKLRRKIPSVNGGWLLLPGEYEIRRMKMP